MMSLVQKKKKKKVCESGLTSRSHNAYRPITRLQPAQSHTHAQASDFEKLQKKIGKIKKSAEDAEEKRPAAACAQPRRDRGSGPG